MNIYETNVHKSVNTKSCIGDLILDKITPEIVSLTVLGFVMLCCGLAFLLQLQILFQGVEIAVLLYTVTIVRCKKVNSS